jgi:hypothetical protein
VLVGGLLTACVPPANQPEDYAEPSTTYALELDGETVTTEVSQAQANFFEGCLRAGASPSECECIFAYFAENVPYEVFEELNNELRDDPNALDDADQQAIRRCQGNGPAPGPTDEPATAGTTAPPPAG